MHSAHLARSTSLFLQHATDNYRRLTRQQLATPGATDTALLGAADDDVRASVAAAIPYGRIATPEEVAKIALFLASDDSAHVTGQVWSIDGGASIATSGR